MLSLGTHDENTESVSATTLQDGDEAGVAMPTTTDYNGITRGNADDCKLERHS